MAERENQNCPLHFREGEEEKKGRGGLRCNYECLEIPSAQSFLKELPKEQTLGDGAGGAALGSAGAHAALPRDDKTFNYEWPNVFHIWKLDS